MYKLILTILFVLFLMLDNSLVAAKITKELFDQNELNSARLVEENDDPVEKLFKFQIKDKKSDKTKDIEFHDDFSSIEKIMFYGKNRFIAQGELLQVGRVISISDLDTDNQRDIIWSNNYSFSPSKRYLVYVTHYPKMTIRGFNRSIILIYDLTKPTFGINSKNSHELVKRIGIPIYPEANAKRKSYDVTLEDKHIFRTPFLWSEDENKLLFFDYFQENNFMILIDLTHGIHSPKIFKKFINIKEYFNLDRMTEETKKEKMSKPGIMSITDISWAGPNEVIIIPYARNWFVNEIKLTIPQQK